VAFLYLSSGVLFLNFFTMADTAKQYTLVIVRKDKQVGRQWELSSLSDLKKKIAADFKILEFQVRYYSDTFQAFIDFENEDLNVLPQRAKLEIIETKPITGLGVGLGQTQAQGVYSFILINERGFSFGSLHFSRSSHLYK